MIPTRTSAPRVALLLALCALLPACGGWVSMTRISSAQRKPNNAWVFFSVDRISDAPVTGLTADDFMIYEDGNPVPKADSKQLLQSPDTAAVLYTLLLVDLSGTTTAAPPVLAAGTDPAALDDVGRDAAEAATAGAGVGSALDRVAAKIEAHGQRYYLLSFCTAARKGEREVRVEAHTKNPDGSGSLSYTFKADGLGPPPECDPHTAASFDVKEAASGDRPRSDAPSSKQPRKASPKTKLIDMPP